MSENTEVKFKVGSGQPGPGRPKGSMNKLGREAAAQVLEALEELGGKRWLVQTARRHPSVFARLLAHVLPRDINLSGSLSLSIDDLLTKMRHDG